MKGKGLQVCFYPIWDKCAGFDPEREAVSAVPEGETLELCEDCCNRVFDDVYENKKK